MKQTIETINQFRETSFLPPHQLMGVLWWCGRKDSQESSHRFRFFLSFKEIAAGAALHTRRYALNLLSIWGLDDGGIAAVVSTFLRSNWGKTQRKRLGRTRVLSMGESGKTLRIASTRNRGIIRREPIESIVAIETSYIQ